MKNHQHLRGGSPSRHRAAGLAIAFTLLAGVAQAQPRAVESGASTPARLTEAEIRAKYQNCADGYYSGPRPGKVRFTKDRYVWAVTPAFAASFCMPPEFVSPDLQGAEAVAYRIHEDLDEEFCGLGGRPEACMLPRFHQFEIYYRTGTIAKKRDVPYFQAAQLPAGMLISTTEREWQRRATSVKEKPRTGALGPFADVFGLLAIDGDKVRWSMGSAYPNLYYEQALGQLDYLSLRVATGFSSAPAWPQVGAVPFVIGVGKPDDTRRYIERRVGDFPLVIRLPERIRAAVLANDRLRPTDLNSLVRPALPVAPALNRRTDAVISSL